MKNKLNQKLYKIILSGLLIVLASTDICLAEPISGSAVVPFQTILIKFGIAMGAVVGAVLVIFLGLKAFKEYARKTLKETKQQSLYNDTLETPKSVDDAIISFIDKNRL